MRKGLREVLFEIIGSLKDQVNAKGAKDPTPSGWLQMALSHHDQCVAILNSHQQLLEAFISGKTESSPFRPNPYLWKLHAGYALENLSKGILFEKTKKVVATHRLSDLFARAGIETSPKERAFLDSVTECVVWKAKYPTPLAEKDTQIKEPIDQDSLQRLPGDAGLGISAEKKMYFALYGKLKEHQIYQGLEVTLKFEGATLRRLMTDILRQSTE